MFAPYPVQTQFIASQSMQHISIAANHSKRRNALRRYNHQILKSIKSSNGVSHSNPKTAQPQKTTIRPFDFAQGARNTETFKRRRHSNGEATERRSPQRS
jgi:hypothetical protein